MIGVNDHKYNTKRSKRTLMAQSVDNKRSFGFF